MKKLKDIKIIVVALLMSMPLLMQGRTIKVFAIGNSFSEDAVEHYLYELAMEGHDTLIIGNAYRGGQGFESHWNVVEGNKADFEFRKIVNGKRSNNKHYTLLQCLENEPWDIITFQQVSQDSGDYSTYEPWLTKLMEYVRAHATNPNVKYGLHRTWAYAADSNHSGFVRYDKDQDKMFKAIVDATNRARKTHPELSFLIPSGTAIQNGRTSYIGDRFNRDGFHLSYKLGRYTAALTWLEVITGQSAIGKKYAPEGLNKWQIEVAQNSAHAAVGNPDEVTTIDVTPEDMDENGYVTLHDVPYRTTYKSDYQRQQDKMDIYLPTREEGFTTVVWFHGGGMSEGGKYIPAELQKQGICVIGVGYSLCAGNNKDPNAPNRNVTTADGVDDAAAATAWVLRHIAEYGGNPKKVILSGHSAGGYITLLIGMDKSRVAKYGEDVDKVEALVPFSGQAITHYQNRRDRGISDYQPIIDTEAPLYWVRKDCPPILLICGQRERELLGRYEENAYLWRMLQLIGHKDAHIYELDGFSHGTMYGPAHSVLLEYIRNHP